MEQTNQREAKAESTGAEEVLWDLSHLYSGADDPRLQADLDGTLEEAKAFRSAYGGRVRDLDERGLREAVARYEAIQERLGRVETYAYLWFATDTGDPARGKLLQSVREREASIRTEILFFDLEWTDVPDERAIPLLASPDLAHWRHYLEAARRYRPHLLSEPEEKILAQKSVTGASAWVRLFEEAINDIPFVIDGLRLTEEEVLSRLYQADRTVRQKAAQAMTEGLQGRLRILTFIFNMLASDKAIEDRLRRYPHWLAERNLANEISDDMVRSLVATVVGRYDLPQRYYRLKRRLLDMDVLYDYDRYAPVSGADRRVGWQACQDVVLQAFGSFSPPMAEMAQRFFRDRWIHAAVQRGKRGGAFSHPAVPSVHPYVMVNFNARVRDIMTVAHELGHGVHQLLAAAHGYLSSQTPLTIAETASVFGEMLSFELLMEKEVDPRAKLALLCGKIEDILATTFRQIAMNRFEEALHTWRRETGELSSDELSRLWMETQRAMFGDSVVLTDGYAVWWSYIPHFLHTPGYVYAYAFAELLVLALISRYRDVGTAFVPGYVEMLALGGSERPEEVVARAGLDLHDPRLWQTGLGVLEGMIEQAEQWAGA